MNKENQRNVIKIIIEAGEAKKSIMEAVKSASEGDFNNSKDKIKVAEEKLILTHQIHTSLLGSDIYNEEINILTVHAEDHLMTTMLFLEVSKEIVNLYERLSNR